MEELDCINQKLAQNVHWLPAPEGMFLAALKDDANWAVYDLAAILSPRETPAGALCGAAGRLRILGRLAAKAAVGRLSRTPPEAVEIRSGPEGRPLSFRPPAENPEGFVSIAHTAGAAAAVASAAAPAGLDVERWSRPLTDRAWRWAFSPEERRLAEGAGGAGGGFPARLALWCAKEAAAKSWGQGLLSRLPEVRAVEADWPAGRLTIRGGGRLQSEVRLSRWDDFLLALARPQI